MKIVHLYETDDGKRFECHFAAKRHEVEKETLKALATVLNDSVATGRPDAILRQLLLENVEVSRILTSYRRRVPQEQERIAS